MKRMVLFMVCLSIMLLGACNINTGKEGIRDVAGGTKLVEEEDIRQDGTGVKRLEVTNGAGDIRIEKSSNGQIIVHATKTVCSRDEEKEKEVMNNIKIAVSHDGESLTIDAKRKDQESASFWQWKNNLFEAMEATVDYTIQVPEGVQTVNIRNGVGNVRMDSLKASCQVHTGVGDIQWNGMQLTGESSVSFGTGNATIEADLSQARKLEVVGGVGDIKLLVPKGSGMSLKASVGVGNFSGNLLKNLENTGRTVASDLNGGGTAVKVSSGTGNIEIEEN